MKKIIYSLLMLVAVGMTFSSCSEDRDSNPTFNPNDVKSFTLNMPGYALNNAYDLEHSEYLVLTTSQPDYGFPVSTVYTVWVSLDNEHFENLATTSTNTYISVPASELNEKILTMAGDKDLSQP
ncbi:MAG: SusE domain-containing protein, partial [Bacteroidaceae bacterium]|nr:SusE domain-containing protein [Bacteroidaceae bacterium]